MRFLGVLVCCGLLAALPASAKTPQRAAPARAPAPAEESLEITADQSLEWYQTQKLYVARGKAKAVRGDVVIEADLLSAHARDSAKDGAAKGETKTSEAKGKDQSMGSIDRLLAEGNVHITDPKQQVFGDKAVYDLDRRVATITGDNLTYKAGTDTVTARESMDYFEEKDMAVARGKARATRADGSRIDGDVLTAHFTTNAAGQKEMTTMTAEGHVTVYTDGDVARGNHAVYDVKKNVATLSGNVRITREDTQLAGDRAEVDFASGESRLLNDGSGRVRALLPSSGGRSPEKKTAGAS